MKIYCYLTGRLGNQLFQYAFARSLQNKYGGQIIFNTYEFDHYGKKWEKKHGKFEYELDRFVLNKHVSTESRKLPWYADLRNPIIRVWKKVAPKLLFRTMARKGCLLWQQESYIEIPQLNSKSIICNGWWQDVRYFENINSIISNEIVTKTKRNIKNAKLYRIIDMPNSVCVSVRGGNYLIPNIKKHFFVCDRKYFLDSIEEMAKMVKDPNFIIFSDDIRWVKNYLKLEEEFPQFKFYYESGNDDVDEKIRMMSSCSNFIISNSTFSWWVQFLCKNQAKEVIAPSAWFTNGKKNGLYQKNWHLINVDRNITAK